MRLLEKLDSFTFAEHQVCITSSVCVLQTKRSVSIACHNNFDVKTLLTS